MQEARIVVAGEELSLLAERALFWPQESTLFIADPHFGKDAAFRSAGIALPQGPLHTDLARLDNALRLTGAERLLILGDFFHARAGRTPDTLRTLANWREEHSTLEIVLVRGNHDRHAGEPPAEWRITSAGDFLLLPPFVCCHMPYDAATPDPWSPGVYYRLCGHLHPVIQLRDVANSQTRLPCFLFSATQALLPAFSNFTGGYAVKLHTGDYAFAIAPHGMFRLGR